MRGDPGEDSFPEVSSNLILWWRLKTVNSLAVEGGGPALAEPQVTNLLLSSCGDQYWSSEPLVWDARDDLTCLTRVPSA